MVAKYRDDKPAPNTLIQISISSFRDGEKYEKTYRSDENGYVFFRLPPVVDEKPSFSIEVSPTYESHRLITVYQSHRHVTMYQ